MQVGGSLPPPPPSLCFLRIGLGLRRRITWLNEASPCAPRMVLCLIIAFFSYITVSYLSFIIAGKLARARLGFDIELRPERPQRPRDPLRNRMKRAAI